MARRERTERKKSTERNVDGLKLTIDCEAARNALSTLSSVTSADHANLIVDGQDIYFSATGNNRKIKILVKGTVQSKGESLGFNIFTLQSILKGRGDVDLALKGNELHFSSVQKGDKFTGHFHTLPFEDIEIVGDDDAAEVPMTGSVMVALKECVKRVMIHNMFTNDAMTLWVHIDDTGLYTSIYDEYHAAFSHNSSVPSKQTAEFAIAVPIWELVSSVAEGQDYTLGIGPVYVTVKALGFELSIPVLQPNESQSFEDIKAGMDGQEKRLRKGNQITIPVDELNSTLDRVGSVSDGNSGVTISAVDGYAAFHLESNFGAASAQRKIAIKEWGKASYSIKPNLFKDTLAAYPSPEVTLSFNEESIIFKDESNSTRTLYTCVLL